jgi:hypothetical protein
MSLRRISAGGCHDSAGSSVEKALGNASDQGPTDRTAVGGADHDRVDVLLFGEVGHHPGRGASAEDPRLDGQAGETLARLFEQRLGLGGSLVLQLFEADREWAVGKESDDQGSRP